ncbi:hypothetical protein EC973_006711 [Apophysomyces ossiformis]|uniref:Uncharacterized protein n=1 Tax=Apophysomyces ossiformis TaxID=679940 RepID=A0A8H7EQX2_9FUNG|nr:hypothetical protein EC973_006711 [Apophysomyces ossiformis]
MLSGSNYPTMEIVIPTYNVLMDKLDNYTSSNSELQEAAAVCFEKLQKYYNMTDFAPICSRQEWETEWVQFVEKQVRTVFMAYPEVEHAREDIVISSAQTEVEKDELLQHLFGHLRDKGKARQEDELSEYFATDAENCDPLR